MSLKDWLEIIAWILKKIAEGMPKSEAVSLAASRFGVSSADIWKKAVSNTVSLSLQHSDNSIGVLGVRYKQLH